MEMVTIQEKELMQLCDIIEELEMRLEESERKLELREESPQIDRVAEILERFSEGEDDAIEEGVDTGGDDTLAPNVTFTAGN